MIEVKLASGVSTNDAGKQFSSGMHNRKSLREGNCYFPETSLK